MNRWDPTLGTPRGDKYYNQYRPLCEVCPRDHGKVVESLQGRNTGESAGIVDTVLCVESEGRGFESLQLIFFSSFLRQGLNIAHNIKNVMFLYYYFSYFSIMLHQSEAVIS